MTHDPERWLDPSSDASDELRAVLRSAAEDGSAEERDALEDRLGAALGWGAAAGAGAAATTATTAGVAAKGGLLKGALIATAAIAAIGGGVVGLSLWAGEDEAAPTQIDRREPAPATPRGPSSEPDVAEPEVAEPEVAETDVTGPDEMESDVAQTPSPRRPRVAPSDPAETLAAEVALLDDVQRAIDADPARALRLLAQHRRRFPRGTLVEEREFFTVQALAAAGRQSDARARARRFLARYPGSTHAPRVRRLVAQ